MDFGKLVYAQKSRRYCGKSNITHKALYRVLYRLYFYKEDQKQFGFVAGIPFTLEKSFRRKGEANKFLKENGYHVESWKEI
jgi:hypothetical protein